MKKLFLILPIFLAGCMGVGEDKITVVLRKCPALVSYSKVEQKKALQEIKTMASDAQIPRMMTDYSKLRDACKVALR